MGTEVRGGKGKRGSEREIATKTDNGKGRLIEKER